MRERNGQADLAIPVRYGESGNEPVFTEPWHAQLTAITVTLSQAGHFTWPEWTARFGEVLKQASEDGAPKDGSAYYDVWLSALEGLLIDRGLASETGLADLKQSWTQAYLETPHGQPVKIKAGD